MTRLNVIVCLAFDHRASPRGLAAFKDCIFHCSFVESAMEVSGTFDLIVQGSCGSLAEYTQNMERIRPHIAEFVSRIETNFVCHKVSCLAEHEASGGLWLPCEGGRKHVDAKLIDKIVAEGDYMRVHVGDWNCLVHYTMQRLCELLGTSEFIKLHRSSLVRIEFIERLTHEDRRWRARLRDGTHISVAKSHVQQVLRLIGRRSPKDGAGSSKGMKLVGRGEHIDELGRKIPA